MSLKVHYKKYEKKNLKKTRNNPKSKRDRKIEKTALTLESELSISLSISSLLTYIFAVCVCISCLNL